ncbi:hypothetical protein BKA70DRAFT_1411644 [Coprinopsis sp. MPI-PUGE-AT-0042]|nr:hypothetical protein BKA70DRAFT_1411644 [Coprinopsis sp. MPI-PUGE-AT-0042]
MENVSPLSTAHIYNQPVSQPAVSQTGTALAAKASLGKRKLAIGDGGELDLMGALPVTPHVVSALRDRIFQLEDELEIARSHPSLTANTKAAEVRPTKRARTASVAHVEAPEASSSSAAPASGAPQSALDEKKGKMKVKMFVDRLKKDCKGTDVKFHGAPKTIKFDEVLEYDEFLAIFGGHGTLVQPTPTNKPTSTVTIMHFDRNQVLSFLGPECTTGLKGTLWTKGGGPRFAKSLQIGQCDLRINSLDVNYSKNGMKCTLKFEVEDVDGWLVKRRAPWAEYEDVWLSSWVRLVLEVFPTLPGLVPSLFPFYVHIAVFWLLPYPLSNRPYHLAPLFRTLQCTP